MAVDQRGHGRSSKPDAGYDFATLTCDLVGLLDALGVERAIAVGQSWGGNVVLELGRRHPSRVAAVACVDGGTIELARTLPEWEDAATALAPPDLEGTPRVDLEAHMRRTHPDWSDTAIAGALANFEERDDGTVAPWLTRARHMMILRELWQHRPSSFYAELDVPVLVIAAGERTPLTEASAAIPRVRALRIPADHDIHAQKPDVVAGVFLDAIADGFFP